MPESADRESCDRWVVDGPPRAVRAREWLTGFALGAWRALGVKRLSLIGSLLGLLRLACIAALAASPVITQLALRGGSTEILLTPTVVTLTALMVGVQIYVFLYDRAGRARPLRKKRQAHLLGQATAFKNALEGLGEALRSVALDPQRLDYVRSRILVALKEECDLFLDDFREDYFEACLITVHDDALPTLIVSARSSNKRASGVPFDGLGAFAYHSGLFGRVGALHDLRSHAHPFKKTGNSDLDAPYRSILAIPIIIDRSGTEYLVGVVTVDSSERYHFRGEQVRKNLIPRLAPYVTLLRHTFPRNANGLIVQPP